MLMKVYFYNIVFVLSLFVSSCSSRSPDNCSVSNDELAIVDTINISETVMLEVEIETQVELVEEPEYQAFENSINEEILDKCKEEVSIEYLDEPIFENAYVSHQIDSLYLIAQSFADYKFVDCDELQESLFGGTSYYFSVIGNIELSDSVNIGRLLEMEQFLEVLSPQIEMLDDNCIDLYKIML